MFAWGGSAAPSGYLLCDGAVVSRTTFAGLFSAIGTAFGAGDGSTTFGLPNAKGRVLVGADAAQAEFNAIGKTGGAKATTAEGTVAAPTFTGTASIATSAVSAGTPAGTNSAPAFTGTSNQATSTITAGTPAGTINAHTTAADSTTTGGTAKVTGPASHTFTGSPLAVHGHTVTPSGTVAAPVFTGSTLGSHQHVLTPSGSNSAPSFTGSAVASLPPYLVGNWIIKT